MTAKRFHDSKSSQLLHSASSINSPWNQGQDTRFCCNTGSRLTNTLLFETATSAAVKYPVGLDSSSQRIEMGGRGKQTSKQILKWPLDTKMVHCHQSTTTLPIQPSRKDKSNRSSNTVLNSAMHSAILAPNNTWGARITIATAPAVTDWQHLSWPRATWMNWESLENYH